MKNVEDILLHHSNARPQVAKVVSDVLTKKINIRPHPTYNSHLASCDLWRFPAVNRELKGTKVEMGDALKGALK